MRGGSSQDMPPFHEFIPFRAEAQRFRIGIEIETCLRSPAVSILSPADVSCELLLDSWRDTARNISVKDGKLNAELQKMDGSWVDATIELTGSSGKFKNVDGKFVDDVEDPAPMSTTKPTGVRLAHVGAGSEYIGFINSMMCGSVECLETTYRPDALFKGTIEKTAKCGEGLCPIELVINPAREIFSNGKDILDELDYSITESGELRASIQDWLDHGMSACMAPRHVQTPPAYQFAIDAEVNLMMMASNMKKSDNPEQVMIDMIADKLGQSTGEVRESIDKRPSKKIVSTCSLHVHISAPFMQGVHVLYQHLFRIRVFYLWFTEFQEKFMRDIPAYITHRTHAPLAELASLKDILPNETQMNEMLTTYNKASTAQLIYTFVNKLPGMRPTRTILGHMGWEAPRSISNLVLVDTKYGNQYPRFEFRGHEDLMRSFGMGPQMKSSAAEIEAHLINYVNRVYEVLNAARFREVGVPIH